MLDSFSSTYNISSYKVSCQNLVINLTGDSKAATAAKDIGVNVVTKDAFSKQVSEEHMSIVQMISFLYVLNEG